MSAFADVDMFCFRAVVQSVRLRHCCRWYSWRQAINGYHMICCVFSCISSKRVREENRQNKLTLSNHADLCLRKKKHVDTDSPVVSVFLFFYVWRFFIRTVRPFTRRQPAVTKNHPGELPMQARQDFLPPSPTLAYMVLFAFLAYIGTVK